MIIHVDLDFHGLQKEFVNIKIPKKKPKAKELTEQDKQLNREKSSVRVKCEHFIRTYAKTPYIAHSNFDELHALSRALAELCVSNRLTIFLQKPIVIQVK